MSSSFLRDFYRRYYGKEMLQRALCLLTVHRKKPYNNSGSFEKRKEIFRQLDAEPAEDHIRIAKRHVSYLMTKNIIERRSMFRHRLFLFGE